MRLPRLPLHRAPRRECRLERARALSAPGRRERRLVASERVVTQNIDMTLPERPSSPSPRGSVSLLRFLAKSRCALM